MRFASLLPTTSRSHRRAPSRLSEDEATIPLTSLDPDASFDHATTPLTKTSSSTSIRSRFPLRKALVFAIIVVATYKLSLYVIYADYASQLRGKIDDYRDRYASWRGYGKAGEAWEFSRIPSKVRVLGRGYESVETDKLQSWKAIPYAQPPTGERRFRTALPLEEATGDAEETKYRVMDEWDTGCVRPRPREDRQDGPKEDFEGHEDCLK